MGGVKKRTEGHEEQAGREGKEEEEGDMVKERGGGCEGG